MIRGCFINNTWVETKKKLAVLSPWSGETMGEVSLAAAGEWEAAIAAA
jgi:acyl-CoA reductase-like NAD-dependent aldehyde dehydrogenase